MIETKISQKIAVLKQYQINYSDYSESGFNIVVINTQTLDKYMGKNVKINNINFKGFQTALTGKNKDFAVQIKQIEVQKEGQKAKELEMTINFRSAFLMSVSEKINLPFLCKTSELDFFMSKIEKLGQKIKQTNQKNQKMDKKFKVVEEKEFKSNIDPNYGDDGSNEGDYDIKPFQSITLAEHGRYLIEISMYLNINNTYYYFYNNISYQTPFSPNGAVMAPVSNQFFPIKISYIVNNTEDKHTFYAYDIVDYPFKVRNVVITAIKLPE